MNFRSEFSVYAEEHFCALWSAAEISLCDQSLKLVL